MTTLVDYWFVPVGIAYVWWMMRQYDKAVIAEYERRRRKDGG